MRYRNHGFSLFGLTAGLAALGVILGVVYPGYQNFSARAKFSEAVVALRPAKLALADFIVAEGRMPASLEEAGITGVDGDPNRRLIRTRHVQRVDYQADPDANRATLIIWMQDLGVFDGSRAFELNVEAAATGIRWDCTNTHPQSPLPEDILPLECRDRTSWNFVD